LKENINMKRKLYIMGLNDKPAPFSFHNLRPADEMKTAPAEVQDPFVDR
jgi:hypothetical protein